MRGTRRPAVAVCLPLVLALISSGVAGGAGPPSTDTAPAGESGPPSGLVDQDSSDRDVLVLSGDYVVLPPGGTMPCPFSVEGNVIVRSGATLTMRGGCGTGVNGIDFHIVQSPGSDFNIIVESGATLVISGATVDSDEALDIQGNGSAEVRIENSKVDLDGGEMKGAFTSIEVSDSEIDAGVWTAPAFVTVKNSKLDLKTITLNFNSIL
ncbi:MAG TPA: hypothetical protein VI893_00435, partial [Thermoplasmata archaeon]|nr:hypothetical protein [Thermoplasmata archaeon]